MTNDFSGGLRGLRPPATFLQPFGLRLGESTILMPLQPFLSFRDSWFVWFRGLALCNADPEHKTIPHKGAQVGSLFLTALAYL